MYDSMFASVGVAVGLIGLTLSFSDLPGAGLVANTGNIDVGTECTYPPYSYRDAITGKIVGSDVELIETVAHNLRMDVSIHCIVWDDLFTALNEGDIDLIADSTSITADRLLRYVMSRPYAPIDNFLAGRADLKGKLFLKSGAPNIGIWTGLRLSVLDNTTNSAWADAIVPFADIIRYGSPENQYEDLRAGRVDVVFTDPSQFATLRNQSVVKLTEELDYPEILGYGVGFVMRDRALKKKIDAELNAMLTDGRLGTIQTKYFYGPRLEGLENYVEPN
jgi:polar amino acid transport system substrate-binding protein